MSKYETDGGTSRPPHPMRPKMNLEDQTNPRCVELVDRLTAKGQRMFSVRISNTLAVRFLTTGQKAATVIEDGIPGSAELVGAYVDHSRGELVLWFVCPQADVPSGPEKAVMVGSVELYIPCNFSGEIGGVFLTLSDAIECSSHRWAIHAIKPNAAPFEFKLTFRGWALEDAIAYTDQNGDILVFKKNSRRVWEQIECPDSLREKLDSFTADESDDEGLD